MQVSIAPILEARIRAQLATLHAVQTLPFAPLVQDYRACLQRNRELEVRAAQLDKEAAELRDEARALAGRLAASDEAAAQDWATKAEAYRLDLSRAQAELTSLLRDKSRALEELLAANSALKRQTALAEEQAEELARLREEVASLKERLAALGSELDSERAARQLAAAEAEARVAAKEAAEAAAASALAENRVLVARLVEVKEKEAERLNQINKLHDEALESVQRQNVEAGAERQLFGMLRRRTSSTAAADIAAAAGSALAAAFSGRRASDAASGTVSGGGTPRTSGAGAAAATGGAGDAGGRPGQQHGHATLAGAGTAALAYATLKEKMGLPEGHVVAVPERQLPMAPAKVVAPAHKGGCCGLAFQRSRHFVATCGMDRTAAVWDLNLLQPVHTYSGAMGTVNDVDFTCDGRYLLGASADKRLLVWDVHSGQTRHTLTGHAGAVLGVCCSPLDPAVAVSSGEDRAIKVWDLARGYSSRSIPCTKMPNALAVSLDGSTILTGHLDGTLCLWDMRQSRAGCQPLAELHDHTQTILGISLTHSESVVLTLAKDNLLRLWDFRALSVTRVLRAPAFVAGSIGSMGRGKAHAEVSRDGRWAAAGSADGGVYVWDLRAPAGSGMSTGGGAAAAGVSGGGGGSSAGVTILRHHKHPVVAAGWASDCTALVSCDKAGEVAFWPCT